jgi:hypothetical protein
MKLIAHRGLLHGPSALENHPDTILSSLGWGFDVEVDVWDINDKFVLGHDRPEYEIGLDFLDDERVWIHCKNLAALDTLYMAETYADVFWHQSDDVAVTRKGFFWTYPGRSLVKRSVYVLPELVDKGLQEINKINCHAVCTDYGLHLRDKLVNGQR